MAQIRRVSLPWMSIFSNTNAANGQKVHPCTGWMNAAQADKLRVTLEVSAKTPNATVAVFYQLCDVPNSPVTQVEFGNQAGVWVSVLGITYPDQWTSVTAATATKQLIRFGYSAKNSVGTALENITVGGFVEIAEST